MDLSKRRPRSHPSGRRGRLTHASETPTARFVLDKRVVRGCTVVTLGGELDLGVTAELRRALTRLASATHPHVVVDLRLVDFMDCSALGAFVWAYRAARASGGCLHIVPSHKGSDRLLYASELDGVFCLFATLDAATSAACARHPQRS
ncbi:MAG: STAS domain-containing protein [Nocardioides sp.]